MNNGQLNRYALIGMLLALSCTSSLLKRCCLTDSHLNLLRASFGGNCRPHRGNVVALGAQLTVLASVFAAERNSPQCLKMIATPVMTPVGPERMTFSWMSEYSIFGFTSRTFECRSTAGP